MRRRLADVSASWASPRNAVIKVAGVITVLAMVGVLAFVWVQFRGGLAPTTKLTLLASRSGLSMDHGSKVTYNGVVIGRVTAVEPDSLDKTTRAKITLEVTPDSLASIPANATATIKASTVFGNKYVAFSSPKNPSPESLSPSQPIDVSSVTTEFDTLFETIMSIAEKVDPIKLNATLSATAEALTGLGDKFGRSLVDGNAILDQVNPRMPQVRYDIQRLADLADIYADASPDLWDALRDAVTTVKTLNGQRDELDAALMASVGFGNTGADILRRGNPFLVRGMADLVPTADLLDEYSPQLLCMFRNYHDVAPKVAAASGGNGYSAVTNSAVLGAENPYVYPDNLPRTNASGGPGGKPGCWQPITRDLWPAPYLVTDTGASIAPYNHMELGQPILNEYVWGRQVGENTINP
ncbi:MCE family protein [Mycobacterium sp. 2YAF39]|uniref:MCE family protein n=1 Tax=Mycobacterium sp. 2YAF39 TaxID=3233033 RepID=UPI003F953AD5